MIVRDEEQFLDDCLRSAEGIADEIIVLDTGSHDRTIEIAVSYGAKVFSFEWTESYSEARNRSIELATGDWILILDADERLDASTAPLICEAVQDSKFDAYRLIQINYCSSVSDAVSNPTCRLWRNRPEYRYQGRVHEDAISSILKHGANIRDLDARIHHLGTQPEILKQRNKVEKYIELIERELHDHPGDPRHLRDMAMSLQVIGEHAKAIPYLEQALKAVNHGSPLAEIIFASLARAWFDMGEYEKALMTVRRAGSSGTHHPEMSYTAGQSLTALDRFAEAIDYFNDAIELGKSGSWTGDSGAWGCKAHYSIAICMLKLDDPAGAVKHALTAIEARPDMTQAHCILAEAYTAQNRLQEALDCYSRSIELDPSCAAPYFSAGDIIYSAGEYATAADLYSGGLTLKPDHAPGFFMLGNCYFRLGAYEAAVMAYRQSLSINPDHIEARNNLELAEEALNCAKVT